MKRCAQCHGKLGLGVRSRKVWNGRWWVHVRIVRRIVRPFINWSDTTPAPTVAGTPSYLAPVRRAEPSATSPESLCGTWGVASRLARNRAGGIVL